MRTFTDYCSCVPAPGKIYKVLIQYKNMVQTFYVSSSIRALTIEAELADWLKYWAHKDNLSISNIAIAVSMAAVTEIDRANAAVASQSTRAGKIINMDSMMRYLRAMLENNKHILKNPGSFEM